MPQFHLSKLNYNLHKYAAFLSLAVILLLGVVFLQPFSSDNSYAADHKDTADGSYNGTTYSLTTTVSDLNLELKNVPPAGKAVYGKQTVNVVTTAPGGYQLYMQTSGNLAGTKDGTATSDSIAALSSNNSALDTNSWGYVTASALSSASTALDEDMDKAATQAVWNTPPSTLTQIDATSSAAASGRDTDIYYGIKADNTLSGDNYSGTITYTTVANSDGNDGLLVTRGGSGYAGENNNTLTITTPIFTSASFATSDVAVTIKNSSGTEYTCTVSSVNTTNGVLQTVCSIPTTATASTYSVTVTVDKYGKTFTKASAFSLSAFTLSISASTPDTATVGTATAMTVTINRASPSAATLKYGTTSATSITRSSTTIKGNVTISTARTYTLTVTATWNGKTYTATKSNALAVQGEDMTNATMQSSNINTQCKKSKETTSTSNVTTYRLTDSRNNQKYYVRKFTFNGTAYCMMVENLYLTGGTKLTSSTSNVSSDYTLPSSTTSGYYTSNTTAQMYDGSRYNGSNNVDGSYYNWCAATAGTGGCYNTDKGTKYDICPKYWHLPTRYQQQYIASRINSIGINTFFASTDGSIHAPIYAGDYYNSSFRAVSDTTWWSSTQGSSSGAYHMYTTDTSLYTHYRDKYLGNSVRCLVAASS